MNSICLKTPIVWTSRERYLGCVDVTHSVMIAQVEAAHAASWLLEEDATTTGM